ncbi:MAG: insulinase family protein [Chitinophagaceae bacterium]|nr:insulinase family protein [Chitinophagaceae bacterium]
MLNLRFALVFSVMLSFFSASAQNKYQWKEATSAGYKYTYVTNDPMKTRFYTLKNGLTVILSRNNKVPRIKTLIAVRAGSNSDPKDHTGLAHYLEHLLFKGTYQYGSLDSTKEKEYLNQITSLYDQYNQTTDEAKRKEIYKVIDSVSGVAAKYAIPGEYEKMMTSMGAQGTNAHTSVEETVYEEDIPSNAVDKFLALQSERFRNPVFRLFHTELEAVYEEKNRGLDNDLRKVWEAMLATMFPHHNYGQQTTIGTIEHLKNPSLQAIREFYDKNYVPSNMAIIFAGDFNPDEVVKKIDRAFAYMQNVKHEDYQGPKEEPVTAPVTREVFGPDAEFVQLGFRLPGADNYDEVVKLAVVDNLLSNGRAGLMDINLNKQQKLLTAGTDVQSWRDYSILVLSGKAKEGQSLEEVRDLLLSQIELLRKGEFDESLIKAIVANYKLVELQGLDNNDNRASSIMQSFILHRGKMWDRDVAFLDEMAKVTKKDVVAFVNQYLNNNYVGVFKKKGDNKNVQKVEKPPITPVPVNNDDQSDFFKKIVAMPVSDLQPKWLDYDKEITKSKIGQAPVLYVQNKDNELFRLHYRFDVGNYNNKLLSFAANYLQYIGDGKNSAEEITRQFYNLACSFRIDARSDYTTITLSGLQENFDKAVSLFENLMKNCAPDEVALKNLKGRIMKSRSDAKLNKSSIARGLTNYAIYGPKNPFNYVVSNDELNAVTAQQLTDLLHNMFKWKHTIIYYGPKTLTAFIEGIKKIHPVPAEFAAAPEAVKFEKKDPDHNSVLFTPYDMVQSEITWVSNSMVYDPSKLSVIELFNSYFGGDMGSIVFQTIRESKALAYSTYAFYLAPDKKNGRYTTLAYVGSQADKMNEAVAAMNALMKDLPKTEKVLAASKENIRKNLASERITEDDIVFSYLAAQRLGLNTDYRKDIYDKVESLTFEDIKNFHSQYISGKNYTYCVIASADKINMDDLKKIGDVKQLSLDEIFGY